MTVVDKNGGTGKAKPRSQPQPMRTSLKAPRKILLKALRQRLPLKKKAAPQLRKKKLTPLLAAPPQMRMKSR